MTSAKRNVLRVPPVRFGLRSLILAMTFFCVVLGLFLGDSARYTAKKNATRSMIESVGGKIYVSESSAPPPWQNWLTNVSGLSNARERLWRVNLANTKITPDEVAFLRGCHWIRSLDLSGTKLGDADLEFLTSLPKLRNIQLNRTLVTDGLIPTLKSLDRLLAIETKKTGITLEGLRELDQSFAFPRYFADAKVARLFPQNGIALSSKTDVVERLRDDHRIAKLSVKRTTTIDLRQNPDVEIARETFDLLRELRQVREFRGSSNQDRLELFNIFRDLKELRFISFSDGLPSDSDIEDIAQLKHLKYLWFFNSHLVSEEAVRSLSKIETLEWLILQGVHGSLHLAPFLVECKNLRILTLSAIRQGNGRRLTSEELQHTIELLRPLKDLPKLESLRISGNDMQDEVLLSLIEFANIRQLRISRNLQGEFLSDEAIAKFREARPDVEYLEQGVSDKLEIY